MTAPPPIATARLDLHPLPLPLIEAVLASDLTSVRTLASFPVEARTFDGDEHVLGLRREQLLADPSELPWLFRAAVLRETGAVVARIGFHAPPDAAGVVEIGYRVDEPFRRRGLASEMLDAMLRWASANGATTCLGSTSPDNLASRAVLTNRGFVRTGEQWDELDGLEWVYSLALTR